MALLCLLNTQTIQAAELTLRPSYIEDDGRRFYYMDDNSKRFYGLYVGLDFSISDHWQLGGGAGAMFSSHSGFLYQLNFGPTYNFSADDLARSTYLQTGVYYRPFDWKMDSAISNYSDDKENDFDGYLRLGKRFLLSEEYQISYKPEIEWVANKHRGYVGVRIVNFSIQF
jgi:hypothetical protein